MKFLILAFCLFPLSVLAEDSDGTTTTQSLPGAMPAQVNTVGTKDGFTVVRLNGNIKNSYGFKDEDFTACFAEKDGQLYSIKFPRHVSCPQNAAQFDPAQIKISKNPLKESSPAGVMGKNLTYTRKDGSTFNGATILEVNGLNKEGKPFTRLHLWAHATPHGFELAGDNVTMTNPNGSDDVPTDHPSALIEDLRPSTATVSYQPIPAPPKPAPKKEEPAPQHQQQQEPPPPPQKVTKIETPIVNDECAGLGSKVPEQNWKHYCTTLNRGTCGQDVFKGACKSSCNARDCADQYDLLAQRKGSDQITVENRYNEVVARRDAYLEALAKFKDLAVKQAGVGRCININPKDSELTIFKKYELGMNNKQQVGDCNSRKSAPQNKSGGKNDRQTNNGENSDRSTASEPDNGPESQSPQ